MKPQIIHTHIKTKLARAFVTGAFAILLGLTGLAAHAQSIISWKFNNGAAIPSNGTSFAGVTNAAFWNSSQGAVANLLANNGSSSGVSLAFSSAYGAWGIGGVGAPDNDGLYNKAIFAGYGNGGSDTLSLSGISYSQYVVIVYFSSDTDGRNGTVSDGATTYDFTTMGISATSGNNAIFAQTLATTGAGPSADYAVFTNLSGASQTLTTINTGGNGMGISGMQIVDTTPPITLSLSSDTTASPSTNFYVGGAVTFSASFVGAQPITNQWEVNTGSGFVPITGATNTTLTLTNLQLANSGASYALFASNVAGSSNSTPVTLSVSVFPTNSLGINVQFTGSAFGGGNCPTYTGAAVIGGGADVWNTVSNPTGGTSPAGLATGTNLVLFDTGNITTPITMNYVADYVFSGAFDPGTNPFKAAGSPYTALMTGYMGSVSQGSTADTNTITLQHLVPGIYDLYLYVCGRSDGQGRVDVFSANNQNGVVCGPNNGSYSLTSGVNYVHLTPTVTTNGILNISFYGTADDGQGLLNGFQLNGPDTNLSITLSADTSCSSPLNDYVGSTVTFSAAFAGSPVPLLQWEVNEGSGYVLIPGATNSVLTLTNLQTAESGEYALFATNAAGGLNSTPLTLNVQALPSPLAIDVQFDGTTYTGSHAATQVGGAEIGGYSDYWNPVSNPNPLVGDTNPISGSLVLSDVNDYGTPMSLTYAGASQDYNNGNNTPFNGSGSPAANLMQASLVTLNSNTASVTMQGIPAGVYDLYLYSCGSSNLQQNVTRFSANDAYDTSGPNDTNNVLTLETNYVHLTPTVTANGLLTISFTGTANGRGNLNGVQLSGPGATILPPVAGFTATPTNAAATQPVAFTDTSSGNITNWVWSFGDGNSVTNSSGSTTYAYAAAGTYTVSLSVSGPGGANALTNTAYIVVTYAVTPLSTNAYLTSLAFSPSSGFAPAFTSNVLTGYNETNAYTDMPVVTVTDADPTATNMLIVNGVSLGILSNSVASAPLTLGVGSTNVVQVQVVSQDLSVTNLYVVDVTVLPPPLSTNALLSNLVITPAGTLNPAFASGTTGYTAINTYLNNPVTVTATSGDGTAALALSFNGTSVGSLTSGVASGSQTLVLPTNTVAVTVVSQDLSQTNTYTVNVTLQPSQTVPKLTNSVSGNTLTLTWPADHLGYRLLEQTNNLNKGVSSNTNDWMTVPGSTTGTTMSIPINKATNNAYYRLVYP